MERGRVIGALVLGLLLWTPAAWAGGYDTPMLYSARHMGMGGTAISGVNDASALFHNPAGMARIGRGNLLLDVSMLMGNVTASPNAAQLEIESELTVAPFFLLGGVARITDWFVAGLAVYPVASAGATYLYDNIMGTTIEDKTSLFFLEISPGVAFTLPGRVTLGASYRITMVSLTRTTGPEGSNEPPLELDLFGASFLGFKVGAQWEILEDHLQIGLVYRHMTKTDVSADEGRALLAGTITNPETTFTLPSRLGAGIRGDLFGFGLAFDFEYGFNSQNDQAAITGEDADGDRQSIANVFEWENAVTLRVGAEYNLGLGQIGTLPLRVGYVYDGITANPAYPTAFGTPPGPTNVFTAGVGFDRGPWAVNLAYAYRFGSGEVTTEDLTAPDRTACLFCSYQGNYEIALHGLYVDFSYDWE
jgi:long-subunit fatty acid transport protein